MDRASWSYASLDLTTPFLSFYLRYNLRMAEFARVMEVFFFFGLAGSCCVVLLSALDDARELFSDDEPS